MWISPTLSRCGLNSGSRLSDCDTQPAEACKALGEDLPASKRRGKMKQSLLHQGDGAQGASTAELLEKKQGELEERRKRRRDETVRALLLFCCLC
jgi:hypothetical protein